MKNVHQGNPLFDYFRACPRGRPLLGGLMFDVFTARHCDEMHDVFLGLVPEVASAMAGRVIAAGQVAMKSFKRSVLLLRDARIAGLSLTLWRPQDSRASSETDLLHLLANKRLYAREYQEILPLLPVLFQSVALPSLDDVVPPLCDLVVYCTFIQMRQWPTNAGDQWWRKFKVFGIEMYKRLRGALSAELGVEREFVKIHSLLTHLVDSLRTRGRWAGVQGMEGLFKLYKSMSTNGKLFGAQLMRKHSALLCSGRWLTSGSQAALAVQRLIDGDDSERFAGIVPCDLLQRRVVEAVDSFFVANPALKGIGGCFVKWVELPCVVDDGGADRQGLKVFAAPMWFGHEAFDVVLQDEVYYMLRGLYRCGQIFVCCGVQLQEVDQPFVSYSMPVLRLIEDKPLKCFVLKVEKVTKCQVFPHIGALTEEVRRSVKEGDEWPELGPKDKLYHHNIFVTYGPMRFPDERRWMSGV